MGNWLFTLDFHNGFHHVKILPKHQFLLSLQWHHHCFAFKVCPFSLNASPWIFTCIVKASMNTLVWKGIWCLAYMDNIIVMVSSRVEALQA